MLHNLFFLRQAIYKTFAYFLGGSEITTIFALISFNSVLKKETCQFLYLLPLTMLLRHESAAI